MDWVKRINSVLDYIEENLDGEIDDNQIASLFASPQGMFQRVFANITDMTVSEYIRKRRLTQAAFDIKHSDEKIIDIAIKYSYDSAAAFSCAFRNFHGAAPSAVRKSDINPKAFHRLSFTLILSERGVNSMQYYSIGNAEFLMRQIQNISEQNGVKCAADRYRAAVILPEGADDWDLSDAYFETGDKSKSKIALNPVFNHRTEASLKFCLSKEQAALLLVSFDGARTDHKRNFVSLPTANPAQAAIVCLDMNQLSIITEAASLERIEAKEPVMAFNVSYIEDALKFCMCSCDETIEMYYNGNLSPLLMKSGRLYAAVFPVLLRDENFP